MLKKRPMKTKKPLKFASLAIVALLIFAGVACKRPKEAAKSAPQGIQTPPVSLVEPPEGSAQAFKDAGQQTDTAPLSPTEIAAISARQVTSGGSAIGASTTEAIKASITPVKTQTNIQIIIDASGSMNSPIGNTTKLDAVKSALKNILSTPLPPEITSRKVSLRVFGTKSPAEKNDCTDTQLLYPMNKYDANPFNAALDGIIAQGVVPMAYTLEDAYNDFKDNADTTDNLIVMITDGLDSCNGNILASAERLFSSDSKIMLDIIGFDVDQAAQEILKKAAQLTSGQFFLARNDVELANAIDQAISSNLPYNLRIKTLSGGSPIQTLLTIYRAGTQAVVERTESAGTKYTKLPAGEYDIVAEFRASPETPKPQKIIKGLQLIGNAKSEQIINFDLGNINLLALDQNGKETTANFYLRKSGTDDIVAKLLNAETPQLLHLSPGSYDIDAETTDTSTAILTAQVKDVRIASGETTEQTLRFQTGKINLKAQNVSKALVPLSYKVTKTSSQDAVLTGEAPQDGGVVELPPGNYDIYVKWNDPNIKGAPEVKIPNVEVKGGETIEQIATIITGTIKFTSKNSQSKPIQAEFVIKVEGSSEEIAKISNPDTMPIEVYVSPGSYDITATDITSKVIPAPQMAWNGVSVKEGETQTIDAIFKLGTLKLNGKNAKQQSVATTFTIFRAGTDGELVVENSERDSVNFNLTPGLYDVKAEETDAKSEPKPTIWLHDLEVKENAVTANDVIFTSGKLKLICRGKNNAILTCEFNLFTYGSDNPLYSGTTGDEWKEFDIPPGKYYMEAGWHDPVDEQLLKKWINIAIGENEIVEETLRF